MSEFEQRLSAHELGACVQVREVQWSAQETEQKLQQFHARLSRDSLSDRFARRHQAVWCAAALCATAAALLFFFVLREDAETSNAAFLITDAASSATRSSDESTSAPLSVGDQRFEGKGLVRFADGSQVELTNDDAQLLVQRLSPSAVEVELLSGESSFQVAPRPERQFKVLASGVEVIVIGTVFSVSHEPGRVRVSVIRGKVRVKAGGQDRILIGGEAAWFAALKPSAVESSPAESSPAELRAQELALVQAPRQSPGNTAGSTADLRERFIHLHQSADYKKAYLMLDQQREILASTDQDLMRAADVARYSGHPAEALVYLKRVKPGGAQGLTAAFTRGRLLLHELNRPAEAASAFAEVQRLAPAGPLAEDALFREIESRSRAGQQAEVARLAQVFVARYPQSRRRDAVKRLVKP